MRILFVSDTYFPHINGVYYFVCRIGPLLKERGHEVAVIAPSETMYASEKKVDKLDVYGIPSMPVYIYPKIRIPIPLILNQQAKGFIKSFNPDIIHIQDHFSISKAVIKISVELGIPIIGTNHFMPENITVLIGPQKGKDLLTKIMWREFTKVLNKVSLITTPTETGARLIRPHLDVEVDAISSGIDLTIFNPNGETSVIRKKYEIPDKPILLYVGRLDPEKRIEELIHAMANASKKMDFYFVVVGKGIRMPSLVQLSKDLGVKERVIFTGFVPEEDLPYFYKLSRCFIIASIAELLSLGTLQAMASGLPIIAANAGALPELVIHGENGYLFESGDIKGIEDSIYKIFLQSEEDYYKMSNKSLALIEKHDIRLTTELFEQLYFQYARSSTAQLAKQNHVIEQI